MKQGANFPPSQHFYRFILPVLILFIFHAACTRSYFLPALRNSPGYNIPYAGIFEPLDTQDFSKAFGEVAARYDTLSHLFDYDIHWHSLTSLPIAIRIHDLDSVVIDVNVFPRVLTDSIAGTWLLTSGQAKDLASGNFYVMIHTIKYPYGEIIAALNMH